MARAFNGTSDHLLAGAATTPLNDFSVAFWMRTTTTVAGCAMGFSESSAEYVYVGLNQNGSLTTTSNAFAFLVRDPATTRDAGHFVDAAVFDGAWHSFVLQRQGTVTRVYMDGVEKTLTMATDALTAGQFDMVQPWAFGAWNNNGTISNRAGALDMAGVMIFGRILTSAEISAYHTSGSPGISDSTSLMLHYEMETAAATEDDLSVSANDGTATGTTLTTHPYSLNTSPTAAFGWFATGRSVAFTDQSTDSDGTIASWAWDFGDTNTSTSQSPSHTYTTAGQYTVSLTVTDDGGATGTTSHTVTVVNATVLDLFLVGGQSNAMGAATTGGATTGSPSVTAYTAFEYKPGNAAGLRLDECNDPVANALGGSAWPAFVNEYVTATGKCPVILGKAVDGSTIGASYDRGFGHWGSAGAHYPAAVNAMDAMIADLEQHYTVVNRGVLWCQGEGDAMGIDETVPAQTKAQYKTDTEDLFARFRTKYGASTKVWVFRTGAPSTGDTTGFQQIRAAQDEIAASETHTHMVFTGAVDFPAESKMRDTYHYTQTGYNEMGQEGAAALAAALSAAASTRKRIFLGLGLGINRMGL